MRSHQPNTILKFLLAAALLLSSCTDGVPVVPALRETAAVGSADDAADDPALWIDASAPEHSRIIGTDKQGGLYLYDLDGRELQFVPAGLVNNVDLREGFPFPGGAAPIVVASDRDDQTIAVFRFDAAARRLDPMQLAALPSGFAEIYGICLHRTASGAHHVVATSTLGDVKQWELTPQGDGVAARELRRFALGSIAEGCVADDVTGALYIAEENVGIWKLAADPALGDNRVLVDRTGGGGHLTADVEGLAIYEGPNGTGYLVASSQGSSRFTVYERREDNGFIGAFAVGTSAGVDAVSGTDGLEITSAALRADLPGGLLIVQDDENTDPRQPQNFKLVPWAPIATALGL